MPSLLVHQGTFYSAHDEDAFFRWLASIPGVRKVTGTPEGLQVSLKASTLSEPALRELIALHWRYRLPMQDLRRFKNEKNASWFCDPGAYWHGAVFGERAVSANMESRLAALREQGVRPVAAVKAIHAEYAVSLGEAKRRLSLSPSWTQHAAASASLQREAIAAATDQVNRRKRGAA